MRIARVSRHDGSVVYGQIDGDECRLLDGLPYNGIRPTGECVSLAAVKLLAPVAPPQIIAIGLNYHEHAAEGWEKAPPAPVVFVKTINTLIGPGEPIRLPRMAPDEVDYECELVVVIGRTAKNVSEDDATDFILGYTCGNDVSARDCQLRQDKQWARGKCFDTFAPMGPWIETNLDPHSAVIRTLLNGQIMQQASCADMIFSCRQLVSYVSRCMTLYPGSVIMTGTPSGVGFARKPPVWLRPGNTVTVQIDGIGELTNPVCEEPETEQS
jgi:2-keto-4-pentenoate hydratase/2-oxohepta-3-ene-1,7-dioic acid hydratase in catechol pathway